ncbi:MAG: hypothetical protein M0T70_02485 [Geobacteraceae bacterium]|nr:hypothetical protein [Geobacteraceae bacterium]
MVSTEVFEEFLPADIVKSSAFVGVFHFENTYWPVVIPSRRKSAKPHECLVTIPKPILVQLADDEDKFPLYLELWQSCYDYGHKFKKIITNKSFASSGIELLRIGNKALESAVAQCLKGGDGAIESSRLAIELFAKSILAIKGNYNKEQLSQYDVLLSNSLQFLTYECRQIIKNDNLDQINLHMVTVMRLDGQSQKPEDVRYAYTLAQHLAATAVNILSE